MATRALVTVEDYARLPESIGERDVRYELVEEELITVSPRAVLGLERKATALKSSAELRVWRPKEKR